MQFFWHLFDPRGSLLIALIFLPLERLMPTDENQPVLRSGWRTDVAYFLLNRLPAGLGLIVLVVAAVLAGDILVPPTVKASIAALPLWLQVPLLLLLADFVFYAAHRMCHSVPVLWRFHAIHHSAENLDWLAAFRIHPIDQMMTKGMSLIPCFTLGFSEAAVAIYFVFYQWHAILLHSNVRLPFGPLRWVLASPVFHHWHHADDPRAWNRNFGAQLSIWDLMFGTAQMQHDALPRSYGFEGEVPKDYLAQLAHPLRRQRGVGDRIAAAEEAPFRP